MEGTVIDADGNNTPHDFRPSDVIDIDDDWQRNEKGVSALRGMEGTVIDADGNNKPHKFRELEEIDIDDDWQRNENGVTALRGLEGTVIGTFICFASDRSLIIRYVLPAFTSGWPDIPMIACISFSLRLFWSVNCLALQPLPPTPLPIRHSRALPYALCQPNPLPCTPFACHPLPCVYLFLCWQLVHLFIALLYICHQSFFLCLFACHIFPCLVPFLVCQFLAFCALQFSMTDACTCTCTNVSCINCCIGVCVCPPTCLLPICQSHAPLEILLNYTSWRC